MMNLAMNFDTDECSVTAMFDKGDRNDTMEAIDHIIPFLILCPHRFRSIQRFFMMWKITVPE